MASASVGAMEIWARLLPSCIRAPVQGLPATGSSSVVVGFRGLGFRVLSSRDVGQTGLTAHSRVGSAECPGVRVQSRSGDFLRPRFRVPWCAIKAPSNFHSAMSFHMFGICGLRLHVREAPHLSVLAAVTRRWLGDKSAVMGPCGKCAPHLFNTIVVSVCLCVCVFYSLDAMCCSFGLVGTISRRDCVSSYRSWTV